MSHEMNDIAETSYSYNEGVTPLVRQLADRVATLRGLGSLSPDVLHRLRQFFKIKNIYNSNAIEGNLLNIGETRQVVELGMTITGKPLKDQAEAKNLSAAVDFLEELVSDSARPIKAFDIRQIHSLILKGIDDDNAGGYRKVLVEVSGSKYKPPRPEVVPGEMEAFEKWLADASCPGEHFATHHAIVNAAVAHAWLVRIHPFIDGNGRVSRLLMNLILMRYGFPISIVTREDRLRYYDALEESQSSDLTSFIGLITECVEESLDQYEAAAKEQRDREEWAKSVASKFSEPELIRASNRYEVWKNAMDLLRSFMRQSVEMISAEARLVRIHFKEFGTLEFEKYVSLCDGASAKQTWFFRVDFLRGERTARYLFFFGFSGARLKCRRCRVTLHVAREEPAGSYHYEKLADITAANVPTLAEIGYDMEDEEFVAASPGGSVHAGKIEDIGRRFFEEVIKLHFS